MALIKLFALGVVAVATPALAAALVLLPWLFVSPFFMGVGQATVVTFLFMAACTPIGFVLAWWLVRRWVHAERRHIDDVGTKQALWSVSVHRQGRLFVDFVTFEREAVSGMDTPFAFEEEAWEAISESYSAFIRWSDGWLTGANAGPVALTLSVLLWARLVWRHQLKLAQVLFWSWVAVACTVVMSPPEFASWLTFEVLSLAWWATPAGWASARLRLEWARMWVITLILDVALYVTALNDDVARHYSARLAGRRRKFGAAFRTGVMKTVHVVSNMRLPEFVRNRFSRVVGMHELEEGRRILAELGWPVNVDIVSEAPGLDPLVEAPEWAAWKVADTSYASGIRQLKLHAKEALQDLSIIAPAYIRTEEYKSVHNELASTARYFQDREVHFSVDILDDVWDVVRPIFASSRLTKFGDIIHLWEKKYALGFWMTDERGRRKLSRRSFIARVGFPAFKALWAKTFVRASEIMPVAHVSVKDEALHPLKFVASKVRSIIGSPLSHYIGSTVFAHWPNHNFAWDSSPIKVGMPLNGFHMGKLFERHSRFAVHIEGDFTAFDSTLEGPVKEVIRAVRKKGYEAHKDHARICDLIDVMYDQVDKQFLGHTSTGQVFRKGSGLTTGHSSTSMDNSVALVTFYLAAWKELTGLGAREFRHFNELSCYGDDHMLSMLATSPRAWTARNIQRTMAAWGVTNNLEVKKLKDMTFLSKRNSPVTPELVRELTANGVRGVTRAVWHDKKKLVGKLTAKLKSTQPTYRATRLMSYLQLTAHHPEIYRAISRELSKEPLAKIVKNNWGGVPSYEHVLRNWYRETHKGPDPTFEDPEEVWEQDGKLLVVGAPSLWDHTLQTLALLPDLLNPVFFNYGPTRAVVGLLAPHLQWIVTLVRMSNGIQAYAHTEYHLKRSPYNWVDTDIVTGQQVSEPLTTLLVRHWLYLLYYTWRPKLRATSVADWVMRKSADFAFALKAQVITDLPRDVFPFDLVLVAALLSGVVVPGRWLDWLEGVVAPDVAAILDVLWNRILSFLWTSVPPNFGEVDTLVSRMGPGRRALLVEAPTGTGKSTTLVAHLSLRQPKAHRKLIVIEPRTLLVVGLRDYVAEAFGLWTTGATSGQDFDPRAAVWYMTPQAFLGHLHSVTKHDLVVIDECHVPEPLVGMLCEQLPRWGFNTILLTATPSEANETVANFRVSVPIAKVFSVQTQHGALAGTHEYFAEAMARLNGLPRHVKALAIFDTPEQCEQAMAKSHYPGQCLSSKHSPVLMDCPRYFATAVVDVGVTIPGLDVLVSPNWQYAGAGVRYELLPATLKQRSGRVGRTGNGLFVLLSAPDSFPRAPTPDKRQVWGDALAAGVSPVLGWRVDPDAMRDMFGLGALSTDQIKDFERVSHIFLSNFRQMKALELEQDLEVPVAGTPAVMVPTGSMGHFSGSVPQDLKAAHAEAMTLLGRLLRAIEAGDQVYGLLKERLATVRTGPLYRVANVLTGLANDPQGWRPELSGSAASAEDVDFDREIQRIHEMLDIIMRA